MHSSSSVHRSVKTGAAEVHTLYCIIERVKFQLVCDLFTWQCTCILKTICHYMPCCVMTHFWQCIFTSHIPFIRCFGVNLNPLNKRGSCVVHETARNFGVSRKYGKIMYNLYGRSKGLGTEYMQYYTYMQLPAGFLATLACYCMIGFSLVPSVSQKVCRSTYRYLR